MYVSLVVIGVLLIAAASRELLTTEREYAAAREEYEELQEIFEPVKSAMSAYLFSVSQSASSEGTELPEPVFPGEEHPDPLAALFEINSDFIGWISIGDVINYPVVRGSDNERYLDTTFTGQHNSAGTVFMDHRNEHGFDSHVCILYGHNMKDKSMFTRLHEYRDRAFMAENPDIIIVTLDGEVLVYRVFAYRFTNGLNRAYKLDYPDGAAAARAFPNSPEGANRFLVLSTCTNSSYEDERFLIYAALVT